MNMGIIINGIKNGLRVYYVKKNDNLAQNILL